MSSLVHIFMCSKCKANFSVQEKDPDLHLLDGGVACPNHPCDGKVTFFGKTNAKNKYLKVKGVELYQAHQMGLEKERKCGPKEFVKLTKGIRIRSVDIDQGPAPDKTVLRSITLESGKTIHLAPSTHGVVVIKVTENSDGR